MAILQENRFCIHVRRNFRSIADKLLIVFVLIGLSINLDSFLMVISAMIISRDLGSSLRDLNAKNNQSDKTKVTF